MTILKLGLAVATMLLLLAGCSSYTGVSVDNGKAYISKAGFLVNSVEMCDVGSDGKFTNCKTVK